MIDRAMRKVEPFSFWDETHEFLLDFLYIRLLRPAETMGKAVNMSIHDNSHTDVKGIAQHHIGRLAGDSWQLDHLFHRLGHFAIIVGEDILAGGTNILRFIPVKGDRFDIYF